MEESDLISYGLLGLIGAIERYDLGRDIKFETFAVARVKGAIIDELRSLDWVPRSVRARAREVERAHAELEAKLQRSPTDDEMATRLEMSVEEFHDALLEIELALAKRPVVVGTAILERAQPATEVVDPDGDRARVHDLHGAGRKLSQRGDGKEGQLRDLELVREPGPLLRERRPLGPVQGDLQHPQPQ